MRQIQKSIAECISRADFVAVGPDDPVALALARMQEKDTHCALVVVDGKLVGIFTERDFVNRVAVARRDPAHVPMREAMTVDPETLRAHDCISYAINRMVVGRFRHVPIVDRNGRPTSVLDAKIVMMHLIKVFAELEQGRGAAGDDREWIDIGGG